MKEVISYQLKSTEEIISLPKGKIICVNNINRMPVISLEKKTEEAETMEIEFKVVTSKTPVEDDFIYLGSLRLEWDYLGGNLLRYLFYREIS